MRARPGDLAPGGALLAGQNVRIDLSGDLANAGTLAGRDVVTLNARNVQNLGRITGQAVTVTAAQDLTTLGGQISAQDRLVATAGGDLTVQSTTRSAASSVGLSASHLTQVDRVAGLYVTGASGQLVASAGRDLNIVAGVLDSAGGIQAHAGNNVNLGSVVTAQGIDLTADGRNYIRQSSTADVGSTITSNGATTISAGHDLNARAATVDAKGDLTASAGRDVRITEGRATSRSDDARYAKDSSFMSSSSTEMRATGSSDTAVGSSLGGRTVTVVSGGDTQVRGSSVIGDQGTTLAAGHDLNIEAATDTYASSSFSETKKSGLVSSGGGGVGVTVGKQSATVTQHSSGTTATASTVGAIDGDVNLAAGQTYRQAGSDVLAPAGDVTIVGKSVEITEAREKSQSTTTQTVKQSGLTVQITSPVIAAVQTVQGMAQAASDTGDARMKALAAANVGFATNNAANALRAGQGVDFDGKSGQLITERNAKGEPIASRDANAADRVGGITLSASLGSSKSSSTTTQTSDTARGSTVAAGGSVNITASGAGTDSDLLVRGSDVIAGKNAALSAEGDVTLQAAQNTATVSGSNSSSSGSLGVSVGLGAANTGLGVTASASKGRGNEAGEDTTYNNTHITAGNTVSITSGADTTLQGAVVKADAVQADVGGNLVIQSLQDTSTYTSSQKNIGGSVTVGAGAGGSLNASKSGIASDYKSVTETSGIKAGDGGFQINVGNDTTLTGGVIASHQSAVDQGRNRFDTGGNLTTTDLQNTASYSAKGTSIGVGVGQVGKDLGVSGVGAGIGKDSGKASSTTSSGISGIAGDSTVRSTDAETGIARIFDQEKVRADVEGQAKILETFTREAPKAAATYAQGKMADLKAELSKAEGDPARQAEIQREIAKWDEGGEYRVGMHGLLGALGGGVGGALGAGLIAQTAPLFEEVQHGVTESLLTAGLSSEEAATVARGVAAITAVTMGAIVGGSSGALMGGGVEVNNRQLHPKERDVLKTHAREFAEKLRQDGYTEMTEERALGILTEQAENRVDETQAKRVDTATMNDHLKVEAQKYLNGLSDSSGTYDDGRGHQIKYFTNTTAGGQRLTADYKDTSINAAPHVPGVDYITIQGSGFGKSVSVTVNVLDGTVYGGGAVSPNFAGVAPGASLVLGKMLGGPEELDKRAFAVREMLKGGSGTITLCSAGLCAGVNQSIGPIGSKPPTAIEVGLGTPGFSVGVGAGGQFGSLAKESK